MKIMAIIGTEELVKIYFQLDPNDWHGSSSESLWAKPLNNSNSEIAFVLKNSPFYFKGVSYLDIVKGLLRKDGLGYDFQGVIDHSGNSTYRVLINSDNVGIVNFEERWQLLEKLGCTYEGADHGKKKLYSINVPSMSDIYAAYSILEAGERDNIWIFQEGHVGHELKGFKKSDAKQLI